MKSAVILILLFLLSSANSFAQQDSTVSDTLSIKAKLEFFLGDSAQKIIKLEANIYARYTSKSLEVIKENDSIFLKIPTRILVDTIRYTIDVTAVVIQYKNDTATYRGHLYYTGKELKEMEMRDNVKVIMFELMICTWGCYAPIVGNGFQMNMKQGNSQTFRREDIIRINIR